MKTRHRNNPKEEVGVTTVTVTSKCLDIVEQYRAGNIYKETQSTSSQKAIPVGEDESGRVSWKDSRVLYLDARRLGPGTYPQ